MSQQSKKHKQGRYVEYGPNEPGQVLYGEDDEDLGGETLAETLVLGNETGGTDLEVTAGDSIVGSAGEVVVDDDLHVTGKLTVDGLIDPTGLILDEAAAPSTGANKGALFVDPADNHPKYREENNGPITDLLAGGGGSWTTTQAARVDKFASDAVDDLDLTTHFLTIQGGVDAIQALGQGTVLIGAGEYEEDVFINEDDLIIGIFGVAPAKHDPYESYVDAAGTVLRGSIVITDASLADSAVWLADGATQADIGDLASSSGVGPYEVEIANIFIHPWDLGNAALVAGSSVSGTDLLYGQCTVSGCWMREGIRTTNAGFIRILNCIAKNYSFCWGTYLHIHHSELYSLEIDNGGSDFYDGWTECLYTRFEDLFRGWGNSTNELAFCFCETDLEGVDTATITGKSCYWGDTTMGGGCTFTEYNCYTQP